MGNKRKRNNCKDILSERLQAFSTLSWNLESLKTMLIKVSYYCIFIISYYLYLWNLAESFIFFPTASIIPRPLLSSYSLALSPSLPYFIFKIKFKKLWKVSILIFIHYSVQLLSHVRLFVTPWTAACQASLSITSSQNLLKLMSIKSIIPSNYLILCCPLLLLPLTFPSIRIFSNESVLHIRWPKYWSFNFNISPPDEYSGLIYCRINWLDPLTVQWPLKSYSNNTVQKHHTHHGNQNWKRHVYPNVHRSTVYNSQDMEAT